MENAIINLKWFRYWQNNSGVMVVPFKHEPIFLIEEMEKNPQITFE